MIGTIGSKVHHKDTWVEIKVEMSLVKHYEQVDAFRLIFVESGSGVVSFHNKDWHFVAPCFICVNEKESIDFLKRDNVKGSCISYHPRFLNSNFELESIYDVSSNRVLSEKRDLYWLMPFIDRGSFHGFLPVQEFQIERVSYLYKCINDELALQRDGYWPCRSRSYFIELLFFLERLYMMKDHAQKESLPKEEKIIDHVVQYLQEHYSDSITLESLTRQFGINRTTLNQLFKNEFDMTAMQYLRQIRMKTAASLLKNTAVLVNEIIYRVGYKDKAHFNRHFKKTYLCAPSKYRDQETWMY